MGEHAAVAAGTAAAAAPSLLLELLLLGLDGGHLRLAAAAANQLLNRHHLVGLGFVGRPKPVRQRRQGGDVSALLFAEKRPKRLGKLLQERGTGKPAAAPSLKGRLTALRPEAGTAWGHLGGPAGKERPSSPGRRARGPPRA
jgi:hypothetical protein